MMMRAECFDAIHFVRKLSLRKLLNYTCVRLSFCFSVVLGRSKHTGRPISLSIEPTTACGLSCPECPSGLKQFTRPRGMMAMKDFAKIVDQTGKRLIYLTLYFQGEPILNPNIYGMINYAHQKGIYTATSTNGQDLSDENARRLVESGLDRLIISMDGTNQETYERYRIGGDVEKVKEGIKNIARWKHELGSRKPYVIIQFLVLKTNEHQIPAMKKLSKELEADKLQLKAAQVYNFEKDTEMIPDHPKYARYVRGADACWELKKPIRNRCFRMWSGAIVTWDGRVVPCCFDKDADHQMGKLENLTFQEIWKGKKYKEFRSQILENRSRIEICRNCSE